MAQVPRSGENNLAMIEQEHVEAHKKERKLNCSMCGKCSVRTKKKGKDRSFIEGCLFALCCCWICDACFDVTVVAG